MKKRLLFLLFIIFIIAGCGTEKKDVPNPIVTMSIKDYGDIKIELYPDIAYNTVANFVSLTEDGFYDNNTIHRVQKGFVLQGGDPTATGNGGCGYTIKGEFALNGVDNGLSHTEGVISMARSDDYNSAGSQFFIVLSDNAKVSLDGKYAAFGKVIEGMDIIHNIENEDFEYSNAQMGMLVNSLTIEKTTVETNGYKWKVQKIK